MPYAPKWEQQKRERERVLQLYFIANTASVEGNTNYDGEKFAVRDFTYSSRKF
jgi:hypothetical protein